MTENTNTTPSVDAHLLADRRATLERALAACDRAAAEHIASIIGEKLPPAKPAAAKTEDRKKRNAGEKRA